MATDQYEPLVQDQKLLNEVKYASRDFASMADDLLRRLKIEYGKVYNDYATTSQAIMLRDLVAWAYAGLTWYLDRTASDSFLVTARTRAAVERIVEQIAYKMTPASAAGTTVQITFPDGTDSGFEMQDRWKYGSNAGFQFESYAKVQQPTALATGAVIEVDVRQGETRTLVYTSDGTKNQAYRLASVASDRYLAVNATEVWVDGQLWTEQDFLEYEKTNHYEISYLADPPVVRFGDGEAGNIPPLGAEVKIRFLIIDGAQGNVKSDSITSSIDTLLIGGVAVNMTVNNADGARGGTDPETAESAKKWAPSSFAARGAAITQQDYEALVNSFSDPSFGAVAKAYAINPRSRYDDLIFNALIADVEALLNAYTAAVSLLEDQMVADAAAMDPVLATVNAAASTLEGIRLAILSDAGSAQAGAASARNLTSDAQGRCSVSSDAATGAINLANQTVNYIDGGEDDLDVIRGNLIDMIVSMTTARQESQGAGSSSGGATNAIDSQVTPFLTSIMEWVADGGSMDAEIQGLVLAAESMATLISSMQASAESIDGSAAVLQSDIVAKLGEMQSRIGELFSDDCLSNFVQVPILSLDLDGHYVSPSIGLRQAVQRFLESIKEVTHVVEVVDGSPVLVPAEISVVLQVLSTAVPAEVISQVRSIVLGMLKGRDFNQPLYLDEIYEALETVVGLHHVNVEIAGPVLTPSVIDINGNLVPASHQMITYGSLVISEQGT